MEDRSEAQLLAEDMFGARVAFTDQMGGVALDLADAKGADVDFNGKRVSADHRLLHTGTKTFVSAAGVCSCCWPCNAF
jgi:hypothetical protein